ncbi:MAG: hypothetical protein WD042_10745 [Phycisphaeraceae bacterium]
MTVVDAFRQTKEQEAAEEAAAAELAKRAEHQAEQTTRMLSVASGPVSVEDRISADERDREMMNQRLERMDRDRQDLLRQLQLLRDVLEKKQAQLDAQEKAFAQALEAERNKAQDRDFQLTVQMYEQIKPAQAKQIFQELAARGKTEQVVDYLAAMQLRKASAVLKEFKQPEEIVQATDLLQKLRTRGVDPLPGMPRAPGAPELREGPGAPGQPRSEPVAVSGGA